MTQTQRHRRLRPMVELPIGKGQKATLCLHRIEDIGFATTPFDKNGKSQKVQKGRQPRTVSINASRWMTMHPGFT
jgi:hypothetical protein